MSRIQPTLASVLSSIKGATFLLITTRTDARCKKPYKHVEKIRQSVVLVNFDYEKGVFRRLDAEGKSHDSFHKGESWHVPIKDENGKFTPFCSHKKTGETYLRCQLICQTDPIFVDLWGKSYSHEQIAEYLPKKSEYKNQNLDSPLVFLTFKVDSILDVTVNGKKTVLA